MVATDSKDIKKAAFKYTPCSANPNDGDCLMTESEPVAPLLFFFLSAKAREVCRALPFPETPLGAKGGGKKRCKRDCKRKPATRVEVGLRSCVLLLLATYYGRSSNGRGDRQSRAHAEVQLHIDIPCRRRYRSRVRNYAFKTFD